LKRQAEVIPLHRAFPQPRLSPEAPVTAPEPEPMGPSGVVVPGPWAWFTHRDIVRTPAQPRD
jgi:hypothetical protein